MYKIGEFSILTGTTIKTLRYYDEIDLLKPSVTDNFTGYRYYKKEQMKDLIEIQRYKEIGISLKDIKKIQNTKEKDNILNQKRKEIMAEIIEKEKQLQRINNLIEKKDRIEFIPYKPDDIIAKKTTLKKKEDFWVKSKKIKDEIIKLGYTPIYQTISYLEIGYVNEDIDVLIGYTVKEHTPLEDNHSSYIKLIPSKSKKQLVGKDKISNTMKLYQDMFEYAHKNEIQIRGFVTGVIKEDNIELSVEAFDLTEENEDYIHYLKHHKTTNELDQTLVGKYQLRDILPDSKYMFNPKKQKNSLNSNWKYLELKEDGITNYQEITWNKKELLLKKENSTIPLPLHKVTINNEVYLDILMNESYKYYKSQRPMEFIYKKER